VCGVQGTASVYIFVHSGVQGAAYLHRLLFCHFLDCVLSFLYSCVRYTYCVGVSEGGGRCKVRSAG
jgi:hypothetical protein